MPVFELTPQNLDDRNWQCSSHKKPIIIRTKSERLARMKANTAFGKSVLRESLYTPIPTFPWANTDLVTCQELKDSEYTSEGEDGVLYPENH
jgi:hypothetical protein